MTIPYPNFEQLVRLEADPSQRLTTEQLATLACDTERWHQTLVTLIQDIETCLFSKKVELLQAHFNTPFLKEKKQLEHDRWRSEQFRLKSLLVARLRQVKAHVKEEQRRREHSIATLAKQYWAALKEARDLVPFEDGPGLGWHVRVSVLLKENPLESQSA
jgi:hypothetical protein